MTLICRTHRTRLVLDLNGVPHCQLCRKVNHAEVLVKFQASIEQVNRLKPDEHAEAQS